MSEKTFEELLIEYGNAVFECGEWDEDEVRALIDLWNCRTPEPGQPEAAHPKCEGCNGLGMVGGITQEGGDAEECPFCRGTGIEPPSQPEQGDSIDLVVGQEVVDQRDDYINYLQLIAEKIGLETEPHQTYFDRLLERIDSLVCQQGDAEPALYQIRHSLGGDWDHWVETSEEHYQSFTPSPELQKRKLYTHPAPRAAVPDNIETLILTLSELAALRLGDNEDDYAGKAMVDAVAALESLIAAAPEQIED